MRFRFALSMILLLAVALLLSGTNIVREKPANLVGGVEIGIVVADRDKTHDADTKSRRRITSGIMKQSWGVRDFRVLSPDGSSLRFTEWFVIVWRTWGGLESP